MAENSPLSKIYCIFDRTMVAKELKVGSRVSRCFTGQTRLLYAIQKTTTSTPMAKKASVNLLTVRERPHIRAMIVE
jgi:hypothetical protein